jgi:pilus assembly protein CpaB
VSSRRTLILVAAIAVGVVAAFFLFNYVNGVEDRANENAERVHVFMVKSEVPRGTFGEEAEAQGLVVAAEIPRQFLPATAVKDLDAIKGKVAVGDLPANSVLVDGQFVDPTIANTGFSQRLESSGADRVAITIAVDQTRGVAGLVVPGDIVDLIVTARRIGAEFEEIPEEARGESHLLYQNVEVLAVGQSAAPDIGSASADTASTEEQAAQAQNSGLITLSVPREAAVRIALVANQAPDAIYLALAPKGNTPVPLPPLPMEELFNTPALTPYGDRAA